MLFLVLFLFLNQDDNLYRVISDWLMMIFDDDDDDDVILNHKIQHQIACWVTVVNLRAKLSLYFS